MLASGDTAAAFALADRLMREGRDVRELLKSAANHFRDVLALKVGADALHKTMTAWRAQAERYSQDRLVRIIDVFSGAEKELRWNEQHRLGLEMALLKSMITATGARGSVRACPPCEGGPQGVRIPQRRGSVPPTRARCARARRPRLASRRRKPRSPSR